MLQKSGRLVLWEAMFILELHSAETQDEKIFHSASVRAKHVPLAHSTLPNIRISWDYHPTFMLISGRVLRSFTHL